MESSQENKELYFFNEYDSLTGLQLVFCNFCCCSLTSQQAFYQNLFLSLNILAEFSMPKSLKDFSAEVSLGLL